MIKNYNEYINEKLSDKLSGFDKKDIEKQLITGKITIDRFRELSNKYNFIISEDVIYNYIYQHNKNNPNDLLCEACKYNILDLVKLAIKNNANINYLKSKPIKYALRNNNTEIFNYLVDSGSELKSPYENEPNYLINKAVENNNINIIKTLLEKDPNINLDDLLHYVIVYLYKEIKISVKKYLIEYGLNNNKIDINRLITTLIICKRVNLLKFCLSFNIILSDDFIESINKDKYVSIDIKILLKKYYNLQHDKKI